MCLATVVSQADKGNLEDFRAAVCREPRWRSAEERQIMHQKECL